MSEMSDRLREARLAAGYGTGSDAARAFGWPISTYLGHENGDRKFKYDTAERYARAFNVDAYWLISGEVIESTGWANSGNHRLHVPLVGIIGTGGFVDPRLSELYGNTKVTIQLPLFTAHNLVALEVRGDYAPRYDMGDIIICRTGYLDPDPFINKFCLIETKDGIWYFRKLCINQDGKGFILEAINAPPVEDFEVSQIGSVYMTLPAAQVSPPHGFMERVRSFGEPRIPEVLIEPHLRKTR